MNSKIQKNNQTITDTNINNDDVLRDQLHSDKNHISKTIWLILEKKHKINIWIQWKEFISRIDVYLNFGGYETSGNMSYWRFVSLLFLAVNMIHEKSWVNKHLVNRNTVYVLILNNLTYTSKNSWWFIWLYQSLMNFNDVFNKTYIVGIQISITK